MQDQNIRKYCYNLPSGLNAATVVLKQSYLFYHFNFKHFIQENPLTSLRPLVAAIAAILYSVQKYYRRERREPNSCSFPVSFQCTVNSLRSCWETQVGMYERWLTVGDHNSKFLFSQTFKPTFLCRRIRI